jgi:hypothetical protein
MKDPADALAAARRAAAERPDHAEEPAARPPEGPLTSARRLTEWAIIEPDQAEIYSTRRLGKPITFVKRLLIRVLRQYLGQMSAQQSRFNASLAAHVLRLEERVQELERAAAEREQQPPR